MRIMLRKAIGASGFYSGLLGAMAVVLTVAGVTVKEPAVATEQNAASPHTQFTVAAVTNVPSPHAGSAAPTPVAPSASVIVDAAAASPHAGFTARAPGGVATGVEFTAPRNTVAPHDGLAEAASGTTPPDTGLEKPAGTAVPHDGFVTTAGRAAFPHAGFAVASRAPPSPHTGLAAVARDSASPHTGFTPAVRAAVSPHGGFVIAGRPLPSPHAAVRVAARSGPSPHPVPGKAGPRRVAHDPMAKRRQPRMWTVRTRYDGLIESIARHHEVEPALVKAIVQAESAFDPNAVSRSGARGLMQVLPETASRFAVKNLSDPRQNLKAGVMYLKHLIGLFDGNITMAVAAYNAGPNRVKRYRGVPPYNETQNYLTKVMGLRTAYADQSQRS